MLSQTIQHFFSRLSTKKAFLGFTLVELIVVISVLAVLATISMTTISWIQSSARDSQRMTNVSAISSAFNMQIAIGRTLDTSSTSSSYNIALEGSGITFLGYYGPINTNLIRSLKVTTDVLEGDSFQQYEYAYYPNNRHYQVKATLEKNSTFESFVPPLFAASTGAAFIRGNFADTGGIVGLIPQYEVWEAATASGGIKYIDGATEVVLSGDDSASPAIPEGPAAPDGNVSGFAWSEQAGWIDFSYVSVSGTSFSGSAFGENMGWIDFSSQSGATLSLAVNGANRQFNGGTWGENAGWVNFNTDATNRVYIDSTGAWKGKAWSENFGWISFDDGTVKVWP